MGRIAEYLGGRFSRGKILFTGMRRHLTSMEVRGVQMAKELGGVCCRCRYLADSAVKACPALVWVIEPNLSQVERYRGFTVQFFDPINPRLDPTGEFNKLCRSFDNLILNTRSSLNWLGIAPESGWKSWVIPHHHCNNSGWVLPDERLARPATVGYLGQPEHLHDAEEIQRAVESMGLRFINANTWELDRYKEIDIGIAWTRRDDLRDQTRSNIKLANFAAHGIPSVVCDYESYRQLEEKVHGVSLIQRDLSGFLDALGWLALDEGLRRFQAAKVLKVQEGYSLTAIAGLYRAAIEEASLSARTSS